MDYENYYRSYGRFLPDMIIVALVCPRTGRSALRSIHRTCKPEGRNDPGTGCGGI